MIWVVHPVVAKLITIVHGGRPGRWKVRLLMQSKSKPDDQAHDDTGQPGGEGEISHECPCLVNKILRLEVQQATPTRQHQRSVTDHCRIYLEPGDPILACSDVFCVLDFLLHLGLKFSRRGSVTIGSLLLDSASDVDEVVGDSISRTLAYICLALIAHCSGTGIVVGISVMSSILSIVSEGRSNSTGQEQNGETEDKQGEMEVKAPLRFLRRLLH